MDSSPNPQYDFSGLAPVAQEGAPIPVAPAPIAGNSTTPGGPDFGGLTVLNPEALHESQMEAKYGSTGQQIITGIEGTAAGVLGSFAPAIERGLGVSPEAMRGRQETNPAGYALPEAVSFGASMLYGVGEARLIAGAGQAAAKLAGIKGTGLAAKMAMAGVRGGAELAALQTANEISKAIVETPGQTLGSAAVNVGLAGLLGGAGGAVLGSVSPLWKTASNKIGATKIANDFMGETQFLNSTPDMVGGAAEEVTKRMADADRILNGGLKGDAIAVTLPTATAENVAKIDAHMMEIANAGERQIAKAAENAYLKSAVPRMSQDLLDFQTVATDPAATVQSKWDALDQYKRASQGHANYNVITGGPEEKAVSKWIKPFNVMLREAAENSSIWGEAGNIQKSVNRAATELYAAEKDFLPKLTSKELGDRVADPGKIQTLINQAQKGKGELKINAVNNYLEATQKAADAINRAHIENGLEQPFHLDPTPILEHSLNTPLSPGRALAQWAKNQGANTLAQSVGTTAGGTLGGVSGMLAGHPLLGAWAGKHVLGPVFSSLAKPFAETAINAEAMKSSIDYIAQVAKGDRLMSNSASNLLKGVAEVIPKHLMPTPDSRERLEKTLNTLNENPDKMFQVGGNIGHYLPNHGTAVAQLAATAQNYFNTIKPKQLRSNPFDMKPPIDKGAQITYNRALDIAQQPLIVLQHVKNGTLLPQDVATLNTVYPEFHAHLISKLSQNLIEMQSEGKIVPYAQRQSLSLLMGAPLDSTMQWSTMQQIIKSAGSQQQQQAQAQASRGTKSGASVMSQINKVNALYETPLEARAARKRA
jgi:hypothetical protein